MKIVVFGTDKRVGALVDDLIVDLSQGSLIDFIEGGDAALETAQKVIDLVRKGSASDTIVHRKDAVKLHAPWPGRRLAMAASNYAVHIAGIQQNTYGKEGGIAAVETAAAEMRKSGHFGFWKIIEHMNASGDEIPYPKRTKYLDYEGEAAVVLGRRGSDIRADQVKDFVWGVTLFNDWTIRDRVTQRALQYNIMKNFDGSATLGPCIVVGEVAFDNVDVETRVNGELRQKFNSREMVFSFGEILEHLSPDFTFIPGDIISGGTGGGTAADTTKPLPDGRRPLERFLKVGDVVEISSPQIGSISNRLVEKA